MRKSYRFLSGLDSPDFCQRVSDALQDGYVLYGNPVMIMDGKDRIVGQAVILPEIAAGNTSKLENDNAE